MFAQNWQHRHMKFAALMVATSALLSACSDARFSTPAGRSCERVEGTYAWVGDHRVNGLCEGMYIGRLEPVQDGKTCRGRSGSGSTESIGITLRTDDDCRVYVQDIEL